MVHSKRSNSTFGQPLAEPFVSSNPLVFSPGEGGRLRLREGGTRVVEDEQLVTSRESTPEELAAGELAPVTWLSRTLIAIEAVSRVPDISADGRTLLMLT